MYVFALVVFSGLGIMCVARWAGPSTRQIRERAGVNVHAVLEVFLAIGLAWAVNFNVWSLWHLPVRADWVGVTFTGLLIAGTSQFFTEVLEMFSGLGRKLNDEAETMERPKLERVA